MLLDPETGSVDPFLETALSEGFKGVNDLVFSAEGDVYFTDQGQTGLQDPTGRVYRYSAAGVLARLIDTVPEPQRHRARAPTARSLFVAATRANQIWRLPLHPSGVTTKASIFAHLHGGPSGPDGLALDEEGCLLSRPCQLRLGLAPVAVRGAARADRVLRRPVDHQSRFWRARPGRACSSPRRKPGASFGPSYRFPASYCTPMSIEQRRRGHSRRWPRYCSTDVACNLTYSGAVSTLIHGGEECAGRARGQGRGHGRSRARGPHRVQEGRWHLSLAELSSRTGLVKSTIMRLAVSLEKYGLMARVADSSYRLDAEVFRLGMLYRQSFRLENFVRPVLEELVARLGETASFYVRRGDQRQCLFRVESPHLLRLHVREGDMLPMDSSATAQVLARVRDQAAAGLRPDAWSCRSTPWA